MEHLQRLVYDLQLTVIREVSGHDALTVAGWAEDAMEEAFAEAPRMPLMQIYLDEILKRAPRSREIVEKIEIIKQYIAR